MKLPKSLLQAILVGATIGTAASCSFIEESTDVSLHDEECVKDCQVDHSEKAPDDDTVHTYNCPACGMG